MTGTRDSIFGRVLGRLGFRFVSRADYDLLQTAKRELLPEGGASTDNFVPPNDLEFYLLGKMEGRAPREERETSDSSTVSASPETQRFGHEL